MIRADAAGKITVDGQRLRFGRVGRPDGARGFAPWVRQLRGKTGVYIIRDPKAPVPPLYVGMSAQRTGRLYDTLTRHFQQWNKPDERVRPCRNDPPIVATFDPAAVEVAVFVCAGDRARELEGLLIGTLEPRDNCQRSDRDDAEGEGDTSFDPETLSNPRKPAARRSKAAGSAATFRQGDWITLLLDGGHKVEAEVERFEEAGVKLRGLHSRWPASQISLGPDLIEFARRVGALAEKSAPAHRAMGKVFICAVMWAYFEAHAAYASEDEFKRRLFLAHQKRHVRLSRCDLVGALTPTQFAYDRLSEIVYEGATFHFVRLDNADSTADTILAAIEQLDVLHRYDGLVPLPVLRQELQMDRSLLHSRLRSLELEGRVALKIANSPTAVPDPQEGIRIEGRGLIYYVRSRRIDPPRPTDF